MTSTTKRVHRVNPETPTHVFPMKPLPRVAQPNTNDFRNSGQLYDGAELRSFAFRPGAMDFKKYPSRGNPT